MFGLTVALLALLYLGCVTALQRRVLFPATKLDGPSPAERLPSVEILHVGKDAGVEAWYLPPESADGPSPAVVFAHGNAELIDMWLPTFEELPRRWGIGVLLVEYPGYGRSAGQPSEESIAETMAAAFDALALRPEIDRERIVAYGRSLGGGAACALARQRPVAGLILESTFTSVRALARRVGLFGPLVADPFDNLEVVRSYGGPVLVVHGTRDTLIPASHGRALAAGSPRSTLVLVDCGHNDCPRPWRAVEALLAEAKALPGPPAGVDRRAID